MGGFDALVGSGELQLRIESLEAERLRPVPPPPRSRVIDLDALAELCDALGDDGEERSEDALGGSERAAAVP